MKTGTKFYPFMGEYLASKQGVASLTNMNVLFTMVNNPIKVAVQDTASDIIVSLVGGSSQGRSAINRNEGTWTVKPSFQAKTLKQSRSLVKYLLEMVYNKLIDKISFKILDVPRKYSYEKNNVLKRAAFGCRQWLRLWVMIFILIVKFLLE